EILSVDGYVVHGFSDLVRYVATSPERPIVMDLDRGGEKLTLTLVPQAVEQEDRFGNNQRIGQIGVRSNATGEDVRLYRPGPVEAVGMTFEEIRFIVQRT